VVSSKEAALGRPFQVFADSASVVVVTIAIVAPGELGTYIRTGLRSSSHASRVGESSLTNCRLDDLRPRGFFEMADDCSR
jgi:hypothetical protein